MIVYILSESWLYSSLNWRHSVSLAVLSWVLVPIFLGPIMFIVCAIVQYARDGFERGVLTSVGEIIQRRQAQLSQQLTEARGAYINGRLNHIAQDRSTTPNVYETPRRASVHMPTAYYHSPTSLNGVNSIVSGATEEQSEHESTGIFQRTYGWLRSWWTTQP